MQNQLKHEGGSEGRAHAQSWFEAAVGTAIIVGCLVFASFIYVFSAGSDGGIVARAQSLSPFGVAAFALVTFLTVVWRGLLNTEQVKQQTRQNDAKDEENLAKLLIDGTKLLGEAEESHVLAGVAALQIVATAPKDGLAPHAMDILAEKLDRTFAEQGPSKIFRACVHSLEKGAEHGRMAERDITLDYSEIHGVWAPPVNGVRVVMFKGAHFISDDFPRFKHLRSISFRNCLFYGCEIQHPLVSANGCTFRAAKIREFSQTMVGSNTFEACDFSDAVPVGELSAHVVVPKLSNTDSVYEAGHSPGAVPGVVWSDVLSEVVYGPVPPPDD